MLWSLDGGCASRGRQVEMLRRERGRRWGGVVVDVLFEVSEYVLDGDSTTIKRKQAEFSVIVDQILMVKGESFPTNMIRGTNGWRLTPRNQEQDDHSWN